MHFHLFYDKAQGSWNNKKPIFWDLTLKRDHLPFIGVFNRIAVGLGNNIYAYKAHEQNFVGHVDTGTRAYM